MHIVLGLLGTIITILVLLNRLAEAGIDLGGLNPFLWQRRRKWQKKFEGNPIFKIDSPLDATALLASATARADGDMSSEEKQALLSQFQAEFSMSKKDSAELLIASAYLLGNGEELKNNLEKVIAPSLARFSDEQAESAIRLFEAIAAVDAPGGELKREFVGQIKGVFEKRFAPTGKWN